MKRFISVLLSVVMAFALIVPVGAASVQNVLYDSTFVSAMEAEFASGFNGSSSVLNVVGWAAMDNVVSAVGIGELGSYEDLNRAAMRVNQYLSSKTAPVWKIGNQSVLTSTVVNALIDGPFSDLHWVVSAHPTYGYVILEQTSGVTLCNSVGAFPYWKGDSSNEPAPELSYQWLRTNQISWNGGIAIVSYMELKEILALGYDGYIERRGNYLHIFDRSTDGTQILCSEEGFPLSAISDMSSTAVGTPNNYYTEEGDTINNYDQGDTIYNEFLDITNNTTWFPNGTLQYIDKVVYDESTKTYIVDSHDSYTYNSTTNTYVTNNYRYEYNYHIDYTSVTYIGTTEQYDEEYRYYYQLPDGRSSADLTAEDLEQLSIAFADVVNYARSADDANMRVLYHFDGNTQDSSYWSYCTDFTWNTGASLTYMDEGTFGGSLYLDETEHEFTITLPNASDGSGDFTLQFRYYQSYTAAPVTDSYIQLGDIIVLKMNGSGWMNGKGASIAQTSVGTWNEVALICSGGTLYYYFNGVPYATSADGYFTGGTITFHFGSEQQTYKKLDELRFSRGAIYTPGENYEPTSVPHDTNLTLILPDGERPLADEIAIVVPSSDNLLSTVGLADWSSSVPNNLYSSSSLLLNTSSSSTIPDDGIPVIAYNSRKVSLSYASGFTHVNFGGTTVNTSTTPVNCLVLPIRHSRSANGATATPQYGLPVGTYTLSVVLADGSYSSFTFNVTYSEFTNLTNSVTQVSKNIYSDIDIALCSLGVNGSTGDSSSLFATRSLAISSTTGTADIIYFELVSGSTPKFKIEYEMAMYSSGELEDSPVLAVRSNQTITGYQIGGVRPSYPEKGQVWAMVENGRITSLQQYTGSAWVEVDGRIWTGQRWIPYSSFDVFLLKDCYDIQGTVTGDDYEYIYSESGFWAWFQKQWLAFMAKIDQILDAVQKTSGTGGSELEDVEVFPDAADPDGDGSSWGIVDLLVSVKDGVWHFVTGVVSAGFDGFTEFTVSIVRIGDLFDSFDEDNENGIFIPVEVGGSVWD